MNEKGFENLRLAFREYDKTYCDSFPMIEETLVFDEKCERQLQKLLKKSEILFGLVSIRSKNAWYV